MSLQANSSRGYALLLVVFTVALLALVLLSVARVQADLAQGLRRIEAEAEAEAQAQTGLARATFLLLTEPIGPRSIAIGAPRDADVATAASAAAELRLDGRRYRLESGAEVAVIDEAGLLNLNENDISTLAALLLENGAGSGRAQALSATLRDFVDEDDLTTPMGGEAEAYLGELAPANQEIATRWAALNALGWREAFAEDVGGQFWNVVTAAPSGVGVNLNTAPLPVLAALLGDRRAAESLILSREQMELLQTEDVEALTGIATRADGVTLATRPAETFRVVVTVGGSGRGPGYGYETRVVLADPEADRPFHWREGRQLRADELERGDGGGVEEFPITAALNGR